MTADTNTTNVTIKNLLLLATATFGTSVASSQSPENAEDLIPERGFKYEKPSSLSDWRDNAFNDLSDYSFKIDYQEKIQTILDFSKKIIRNSVDIDSEFVDIVNEDFWELI